MEQTSRTSVTPALLNARLDHADIAVMTVPTGVPPAPASFCACGIAASSQAPRCGSCPNRGAAAGPPPIHVPLEPLGAQALVTYSRWKKSTGTFGPVGRVVATVLLLVPLPVLAMGASVGIGLIGGGIYLLVIMPWALRDIWKRAAIPVEAPAAPPSRPRF